MKFTHMKVSILFFAFVLISFFASAQIERKPTVVKADSATTAGQAGNAAKKEKFKDRLKDLDLTKDQRSKLKEIKKADQAARAAIENNMQLSDEEKKKQYRELKKSQAQKIQSILTPEQIQKFRANTQKDDL